MYAEGSAEEALESALTSFALSNVLSKAPAERDALLGRLLEGDGMTLERSGDFVEIHLSGQTIAKLDLSWLVRRRDEL